jgi:hypothetical protein
MCGVRLNAIICAASRLHMEEGSRVGCVKRCSKVHVLGADVLRSSSKILTSTTNPSTLQQTFHSRLLLNHRYLVIRKYGVRIDQISVSRDCTH